LAARMWVESGRFRAEEITDYSTRSAYAACLSLDATSYMEASLNAQNLPGFVECLYNNAAFNTDRNASALESYFALVGIGYNNQAGELSVRIDKDFMGLVSDDLLVSMIVRASAGRTQARDILVAVALAEAYHRKVALSLSLSNRLLGLFSTPDFRLHV